MKTATLRIILHRKWLLPCYVLMCSELRRLAGCLQVIHKPDRLRGTVGLAGTALDADIGIDMTLRLTLLNCATLTSGDASATKNAVTVDDVRHTLFFSLLDMKASLPQPMYIL